MSISWRIRSLTLGLVLLTSALIGFSVYSGYDRLVRRQQTENLQRQVLLESRRLEFAFNELLHDVYILKNLPRVRDIAGFDSATQKDKRFADARRDLEDVFESLLVAKPYYNQIRLIGVRDKGREIVRVERVSGGIKRVEKDELQQKGDRNYFVETVRALGDEVRLSKIDLNREHGVIQVPYLPTLRASLPIRKENGQPFGIVIINLDFQAFIQGLLKNEEGRYSYFLANESGDYLYHRDPRMTFGFEFADRHLMQAEFPGVERLFSSDEDNAWTRKETGGDRFAKDLIFCRKIRCFPGQPRRFLVLAILASYEDIAASAKGMARDALALTCIVLIAAFVGAYVLASWLTQPLKRITLAANLIGKGQRNVALPLDQKEEIGVLARAFHHMVETLRENENHIKHANEMLKKTNDDLEHFVHIASHDLREPARRVAVASDLLEVSEGERLSSQGQTLVKSMRQESLKMLEQISEFRALAKIGTTATSRTDVPMGDLVRSVLEGFSEKIQRRSISIRIKEAPVLNIYKNLTMALYNGLVEHALSQVDQKSFELDFTFQWDQDRSGWVMGIRNTGCHIPKDKLEKIFNPFIRLESSKKGSGLSLSICKRIAEFHNGKIWVESEEDFVYFKFILTICDDKK